MCVRVLCALGVQCELVDGVENSIYYMARLPNHLIAHLHAVHSRRTDTVWSCEHPAAVTPPSPIRHTHVGHNINAHLARTRALPHVITHRFARSLPHTKTHTHTHVTAASSPLDIVARLRWGHRWRMDINILYVRATNSEQSNILQSLIAFGFARDLCRQRFAWTTTLSRHLLTHTHSLA